MDVIVHSERLSDALLFHELVHVVQYEVLGLRRFAGITWGDFLPAEATTIFRLRDRRMLLGHRFEQRPREGFSVLEEVREWKQVVGSNAAECRRHRDNSSSMV